MYAALPFTTENWASLQVAYADFLTALLNAAADESYPMDGTWTQEKADHLRAILEMHLGKRLEDATTKEVADVMGIDLSEAAELLPYLKEEKKTRWWQWALAVGGGVIAGGLAVGLYMKRS